MDVRVPKSNLKNVYLEKSLATIFDDADLDAAAKETQHSIAWNSGQVCMANSRIYVQNTVAEKFITMFKDNCANVKIGVFTDPGVQMCPLADESQFQSVNKYGYDKERILCRITYLSLPKNSEPMKEEIFSTVVNICTFETEEEVLQKVNDTEYGLHASVYTKDVSREIRMAGFLEV
ncbi:uncharacterized protein LTHEOB_2163 [Lasiodiplodia theobromae]|uniref:uncharacterized protein n=1 Tax=Lasiodiplodia theobromae TaxID=45133 RepID=UPI0015C4015D|nr:uncharacterized protein LTHEOB_2163 [Lasiodiplodia theobromae]KAF4536402.1 hypothetical protein LTHEOB_2163 [Lasiodiplodia theobromae]